MRPWLKVAGLILAGVGGGAAIELAPLLAQSPPTAAPTPLGLEMRTWVWSPRHGRHLTEATVSTVAVEGGDHGDEAVVSDRL